MDIFEAKLPKLDEIYIELNAGHVISIVPTSHKDHIKCGISDRSWHCLNFVQLDTNWSFKG
ncbi:hypothetical protein PROFUN_15476 [Planoprotostelium fungivorum]|uniref:Uncharacterized protein n=1 Tax=Planoprotostelium fungivorum TaxID=1890364 RepID=A0A2P6MUT3_9EUKA|nr:hypothetical protein PROFUN_15476 [Planoprotostelium fungivorum]